MTFEWTNRQFISGVLCLDFANTVIYPTDAGRREDRLQTKGDIKRWVGQALRARPVDPIGDSEFGNWNWPSTGSPGYAIEVRDAIDRVFRAVATGNTILPGDFQRLLEYYDDAVGRSAVDATTNGVRVVPQKTLSAEKALSAVVVQSAVTLAFSNRINRVKECPSCSWLFVDRSNAGRRRWCDMRSCGNRVKVRTHYHRARFA